MFEKFYHHLRSDIVLLKQLKFNNNHDDQIRQQAISGNALNLLM